MTNYDFSLVMEREPGEMEAGEIAARIPTLYTMEGGPNSPSTAQFIVDDAETFIEAVTTSVQQMEAAGILIVGIELDDAVGVEEIAVRTNREIDTVRAFVSGDDGPGGFPEGYSEETFRWPQVEQWFRVNFPHQDFEIDEQAEAMNHILRARHALRETSNPALTALFHA